MIQIIELIPALSIDGLMLVIFIKIMIMNIVIILLALFPNIFLLSIMFIPIIKYERCAPETASI